VKDELVKAESKKTELPRDVLKANAAKHEGTRVFLRRTAANHLEKIYREIPCLRHFVLSWLSQKIFCQKKHQFR
jgi:hypothetical protein